MLTVSLFRSSCFAFPPAADIYAIGFQEIVDLNAGNLLVDHNAAKPWEDKIERTLKQQFAQVASKHLVGLSLCVYVKRALFPEVAEIAAETVGVGIMGVGVSARINERERQREGRRRESKGEATERPKD